MTTPEAAGLSRSTARFLIGIGLLLALATLLATVLGLIVREPWQIPVVIGAVVPLTSAAVALLAIAGSALALRKPRLTKLLRPAVLDVVIVAVCLVLVWTNPGVFS